MCCLKCTLPAELHSSVSYRQLNGRQTCCCWSQRVEKVDSSMNVTSFHSSVVRCFIAQSNSSLSSLWRFVKCGFCAAMQLRRPASFSLLRIVLQETYSDSSCGIFLADRKGSTTAVATISFCSSLVSLGRPLSSALMSLP